MGALKKMKKETRNQIFITLIIVWMMVIGIYLLPDDMQSGECSGITYENNRIFDVSGALIEGEHLDKYSFYSSLKDSGELHSLDRNEMLTGLIYGYDRVRPRVYWQPHPGGGGIHGASNPGGCAVSEPATLLLIFIGMGVIWMRVN